MTAQVDELDELIDFLVSKRADVKHGALDIVLGLTGPDSSPEGIERFNSKMSKLLVFSLRLVCDEDKEASRKALTALINLSQDDSVAAAMLKQNVIGRCMDYLKDQSCPNPRLLVMLMSNLTRSEEGSSELMQLGKDKLEGLNVAILLKRFVMSGVMYEPGQDDVYEHVATILTNVTRFKKARELLLQPGRGTLQALAAQLRAPSELRRQGVAGAIRNVCMSAQDDGTLTEAVSDPGVITAMLGPISGTDPKEPDVLVRECMAESVMVLASSEEGRKALWGVQAPEVLRKGYELEDNPGVCKAMEVAAEYFISHAEIEQGGDMAHQLGAHPCALCPAGTSPPYLLDGGAGVLQQGCLLGRHPTPACVK